MSERLRNGEYYAEGPKIFRAPVWTKNDEDGNTVSMGFHACTATEWCDPASIVSCLNASRHHDALVKALQFYASEWQPNGEGDPETPGLSRSWVEPTDELQNDGGRKAREALAKVAICPKK